MQIASVGLRIGGALIDLILFYIVVGVAVFVAIGGIVLSSGDPAEDSAAIIAGLISLAAFFVYFIATEAVWGATPAKLMLGMRVVDANDGAPIGWGQSLGRNLLRIVDNFPLFLIGIITLSVSAKTQRVGDMAAGTLVVKL